MNLKDKTVCFTGHREFDYQKYENILYEVIENLINEGFIYFGAGGARGFDTAAALAVLKLKQKYPHIHLILVLPFPNQYKADKGWTNSDISDYSYTLKHASKVVYMAQEYQQGIYYKRNRHLVDGASVCVAFQIKPYGGTAYTTKYATQNKLNILNIAKVENFKIVGGK